jgi:uncharacterized RDD family membrane protein YckC
MANDSLIISSATGVDVELAIAGAGSRSHAFIIDWHIRLLLGVTWFAVAAYIQTGFVFLKAKSPSSIVVIAVLPALAIYFLYHPVVEVAMRGRTPGKRMAGVRIVDRMGGTPSTLALLIRNAFRLLDSLPFFYGIGLLTTFFSAQRVRLGDLAAGTLLVHDGDTQARALAQLGSLSLNSSLDAGTVALGNDLLLRWHDLQPSRRQQLARELLRRIAEVLGSVLDTGDLEALKDRELRARLRTALAGNPP